MTDTILTETIIPAPVADPTPAPVLPSTPPHCDGEGLGVGSVDPALSATAQRIADLQAQVADLQKKLQANGQRLAEIEAHSATVQQKLHSAEQRLAEAATHRTSPNIEVQIARNIGEGGLARYLNDGWGILHMQFINITQYDGEEVSALHAVLQRTPPQPQPQPRPTMTAAAQVPPVAPVASSINIPPIPRPQPQPARVVSGTVMSVDDNAAPLRAAVENYVHTILKDKTLTADERNQRLTEQAIANVRARAAERATAGAPLYRPITAMEMSL